MFEQLSTILLVDDATFNLKILQKYLSNEQYSLELAHSGSEAWQKLQTNPDKYHVVLLDQVMPDLSGTEVLNRMKHHHILKYVPVIFQTASTAEADILAGLEAGAHYYLTKPFSIGELQAVVRAAVTEYMQVISLNLRLRKETDGLKLMDYGEFTLKTLQEADALASVLANACPSPEKAILGISELLINAIEHGNLNISYEEKSKLWNKGIWANEIDRRLNLPENVGKIVRVKYKKTLNSVKIRITDEGHGFSWDKFMAFDPSRAYDTHGRGIATAKKISFDEIQYFDKGNIVEASIRLE
jgi:CheY-like chemotaxis protein/anti-sigma regulatory factor (Ser/Thr protein kinase)